MTLVSVIIPVFNGEKTIISAIDSVLNQTYKKLEVLVIDDCSNDATINVVNKKYLNNERVKIISLDKNSGGPSVPRNIGIVKSNGEYIAFLDADDFWEQDKIQIQINSKRDFTYCSYRYLYNNSSKTVRPIFKNVGYRKLLIYNPIGLSTVMISKKIINQIRFRDVCSEDLFFFIDVLENSKTLATCVEPDIVLSNYLVANNSRSSNKFRVNLCRAITIYRIRGNAFGAIFYFFSHILFSLKKKYL